MSLIILAPALNIILSVLVRILISAVIVLLSFRVNSLRLYIRCFAVFIGISLLLAGIMLFAGMLFGSSSVVSNNGFVYVDFSISAIILIICASFFLIKIVNRSFLARRKEDLIFDVQIFFCSKSVSVKAFYDSGNSLVDVFTGKPVVIVSLDDIAQFSDGQLFNEISNYFECGEFENRSGRIRLLPVRTLGNSCFIPAFTAEKLTVSGKDIFRIIEKPTIAISDNTFRGKGYSALINEAVTGQVI